MSAGYSSTPLAKKLGIREGSRVSLLHAPDHYLNLFTDLPENIEFITDPKKKKDLVHYFVKEKAQLLKDIKGLKNSIEQNGSIWISWPKRSSKVATDITEDIIREAALDIGLVDIKVCAVDETWSGLKLVIPLKDRR